MTRPNRSILASWQASSDLPDTRVGMRPTPKGWASRDDLAPRPVPLLPDLSPAELARDAMAAQATALGGQASVSAGAVHYEIGTVRIDLVMGLVGTGRGLEHDLRGGVAVLTAALAALGAKS